MIITGIYTASGGLSSVVYTEVFQMFIFTAGGITASLSTLHAVGGWEEMLKVFNDPSKPYLAEFPHVIRGTDSEFSWTGMFFGQMLGSIWYWCIDQVYSFMLNCLGNGTASHISQECSKWKRSGDRSWSLEIITTVYDLLSRHGCSGHV